MILMSEIEIKTKERTVNFGIMSIPNRKSKCLYRTRGNMVEPLAYFRSDQNAEEFQDILDFLIEAIRPSLD